MGLTEEEIDDGGDGGVQLCKNHWEEDGVGTREEDEDLEEGKNGEEPVRRLE